jgi:hypothetical protein
MYSQLEKLSQQSSYQQQTIHDLQQKNKDLSYQLQTTSKDNTEKIFDFLTRQLSQHSSDMDAKLSRKVEKSEVEGIWMKNVEEINGSLTMKMKEIEKQVVKRDHLKEILQTKVNSSHMLFHCDCFFSLCLHLFSRLSSACFLFIALCLLLFLLSVAAFAAFAFIFLGFLSSASSSRLSYINPLSIYVNRLIKKNFKIFVFQPKIIFVVLI